MVSAAQLLFGCGSDGLPADCDLPPEAFSGRSVRRAGPAEQSDRLDLHQLVTITERGNAEQRARRIVLPERSPDNLPCGHQVAAVAGGDVDGRLQHVGQRCARRRQRFGEIGHDLLRLAPDIAHADHRLVHIERARAGGEY